MERARELTDGYSTAGAPALEGTGALLRFALRRERVRLVVWVAVGAGLVAAQATASQALYDSPEDLVAYRASVGSNAATIAFGGPPVGLDTVAGTVAFEISAFLLLVAALMALFTTGRLSRGDEEAGRTEQLRATRVGRHAPLLAAVLTAGLACAALVPAVGAAAAATGLPATGSFLLGASAGAVGLVFTGIAAVAAQVTGSTRATYGVVGAVFGVAFALRAVGDVEGTALVWASPLGWAQATHPWSDDRWAPLLLCLGAAAVLLALAVVLLDRRDLGAGLVAPRPGPAAASRALLSPLGLAFRLQRAALLGWTVGLVLLGGVYGALAGSVETLFADNPEARAFLPDAGSLVDAWFATTLATTALLAAGHAVSSVLRARGEEAAGRAEPVLATATGRAAWLGGHGTVALLGSAALLIASGAAAGAVRAAAGGAAEDVGRLLVAALAYLPAVWAVAGLAVALSGLLPRAAATLAWTAVTYVVAATLFASAMDWPAWADDLSPLGWTPTVPAEEWTLRPLAVLTAVAAGLVALGFGAFRRRDLATG
ncbi:ABC transporter permease [Geodermatophilus sp. DF01-2]|uniref:ABC transporter permease n=1 Tax=Geodermatophilus sp. DF01-2 TaxID=2559610 RepID=UPI0010734260|nr:ABC transporter permease [Geodermatophilus sp. DF01_2]TFV62723.1 ABC transporter permease [Geodermatophilus sp. DF01_2]